MATLEEQAAAKALAEKENNKEPEKKTGIRFEMVDPPSRHGGNQVEKPKAKLPVVDPPVIEDKDKKNPPADTTKDFVPKTEHEKAITDLNAKLQAKDAELLKLNGTPKITNLVYQRLEQVEAADPKKAEVLKKVLFGNPSDMELWKIKFLAENPGIDDAAADKKLKRTFPELFKDDPDKESQAYKDQLEDLQLESSRAKIKLRSEFDAIEVKATQEAGPQTDPEQEALITSWKPSFQTLRQESKFKLNVKLDDVTSQDVDVEIPADELKDVQLEAARYLMAEKLPVSEASMQLVRDHMRDYYIGKQSVRYTTNLIKKTLETRDKEWEQALANGKKPGAAVVPTKAAKHGTDQAFADLMI
jgi:hypothetical protein